MTATHQEKLFEVFKDHGPITSAKACAIAGFPPGQASHTVTRMVSLKTLQHVRRGHVPTYMVTPGVRMEDGIVVNDFDALPTVEYAKRFVAKSVFDFGGDAQ